jgi:hypothetical protein
MHHGRTAPRCLTTAMAFLLVSLISIPSSAERPASPEEEARLRSEWQRVRENYAKRLKGREGRIAEIYAKERGVPADRRAAKITQDSVAGIKAHLAGGGRGKQLAHMAEKAASETTALAEMYRAQDQYIDFARSAWGEEGVERKKFQEANTVLQKNSELVSSYLAMASEAAEAASRQVQQSGVLERAARIESAVREAGERLSARWERERAARERERAEREREAGERERGRRP